MGCRFRFGVEGLCLFFFQTWVSRKIPIPHGVARALMVESSSSRSWEASSSHVMRVISQDEQPAFGSFRKFGCLILGSL